MTAETFYQKTHGKDCPWLNQAEAIKFAEQYHQTVETEKAYTERLKIDDKKAQAQNFSVNLGAYGVY